MRAKFTVPAALVAREAQPYYSKNSVFADVVRNVARHDRPKGTVFLTTNQFFKRNGTLSPNRWYARQKEAERMLSTIDDAFGGNLVVIPSQLDERGDAYADTIYARVLNPTPAVIIALGELAGDEFRQVVPHLYRIWWD